MRKLFIIATVLFFASCGTARKMPKVVQVPVHSKTIVKERLVPVTVPADSSMLTALFRCDSLNHVRLAKINELKSMGMQSKVIFKNGKLVYRTITKHDTVFVHGKDSLIVKEVPVTVKVPVVKYRQNGIQRFLTIVGAIALGLIILYIVIKFIKPI
jgi:hypothetical protein